MRYRECFDPTAVTTVATRPLAGPNPTRDMDVCAFVVQFVEALRRAEEYYRLTELKKTQHVRRCVSRIFERQKVKL